VDAVGCDEGGHQWAEGLEVRVTFSVLQWPLTRQWQVWPQGESARAKWHILCNPPCPCSWCPVYHLDIPAMSLEPGQKEAQGSQVDNVIDSKSTICKIHFPVETKTVKHCKQTNQTISLYKWVVQFFKSTHMLGTVAHTCNPSYLGGEIERSWFKASPGKLDPISKITRAK
jgi:hypothetical protein